MALCKPYIGLGLSLPICEMKHTDQISDFPFFGGRGLQFTVRNTFATVWAQT